MTRKEMWDNHWFHVACKKIFLSEIELPREQEIQRLKELLETRRRTDTGIKYTDRDRLELEVQIQQLEMDCIWYYDPEKRLYTDEWREHCKKLTRIEQAQELSRAYDAGCLLKFGSPGLRYMRYCPHCRCGTFTRQHTLIDDVDYIKRLQRKPRVCDFCKVELQKKKEITKKKRKSVRLIKEVIVKFHCKVCNKPSTSEPIKYHWPMKYTQHIKCVACGCTNEFGFHPQ